MKHTWFLRISAFVLCILLLTAGCGKSVGTQDAPSGTAQSGSLDADNSTDDSPDGSAGGSGADQDGAVSAEDPGAQNAEVKITKLDLEPFAKYARIATINSGVVIVCNDHKYGAMDLNGNEIVPVKYTSWSVPDKDGKFIMMNERNMSRLFDRDGNELFRCHGKAVFSEGMVVYSENPVVANKEDPTDWKKSSTIYHNVAEDRDVQRISYCSYEKPVALGYVDGYSMAYESAGGEAGQYHLIDVNGDIVKTIDELTDTDEALKPPMNPPVEGYFITQTDEYMKDLPIHLIDASNGKDVGQINLYHLVQNEDGSLEYDKESHMENRFLGSFDYGGTEVRNCGTMIRVGFLEGSYLIDLSKCYFRGTEEGEYGMDPSAVQGPFISLIPCEFKYWYVWQWDGKVGYMDHDGNVVALYDDATNFVNGKALVKIDGEIWLINEDLQQLKSLGVGDHVDTIGEAFCVIQLDGSREVYLVE